MLPEGWVLPLISTYPLLLSNKKLLYIYGGFSVLVLNIYSICESPCFVRFNAFLYGLSFFSTWQVSFISLYQPHICHATLISTFSLTYFSQFLITTSLCLFTQLPSLILSAKSSDLNLLLFHNTNIHFTTCVNLGKIS